MSSGGHVPPWTARRPRPPLPGRGALVSVFGAAWQGCPLPVPLENTPASCSSTPPGLLHPPPLPFGGLGSVTSSLTPMTLRLWSLQPQLALGLSPCAAAPNPICHPEASLFLAAMPLLGAHLCQVLPRPLPLAPCPTTPQADTPPSPGHHLCLWPRLQHDKPRAVLA